MPNLPQDEGYRFSSPPQNSAAETLRREHDFLNRLIETSPVGIVALDRDGRITFANAYAERILLLSQADGAQNLFDSQTWHATAPDGLPHPESVAPFRQVAMTGKPIFGLRNSLALPADRLLHLLLNAAPVFTGEGAFDGIVASLEDITSRRLAEEKVRTSETFLNSIIEQSPYPLWISDAHGTLLRLNEACRKLLRITDDEVVGKYNVLNDNIVVEQGFLPLVRRVFETGQSARFELDYDSARLTGLPLGQSAHIILDVTIFPIRDAAGRITNAVIQHMDITERKRVEDALNKRIIALTQPLDTPDLALTDLFNVADLQHIQDAFAAATGVASIITLPDGTPITSPSNFCDLCSQVIRKTERGLKNCMCSDAVIGRQKEDGPVVQLCLSGGLWDAGASITAGGRHIANWLIGQVKNAEVDESRLLSYAREIGADETAFREALGRVKVMPAEQFRNIADFLFQIASELSLKAYQNIQQARFITDRNRAEAKLRAKEAQLRHAQRLEAVGQLAGGVAHDFNNILAVITGYAEVTLESLRGQEAAEKNLTSILKAAERAAWLTRQLLAFSRKQVLELKVVNLNQAIELTSSLLKRLIGEHIEFVTSFAPDLGHVRVDHGQMELVLMNLVVNARDAMPEGGTLTIQTRNLDWNASDAAGQAGLAPGAYVLLTVSDTGIGMNPQTSTKIFEPFFSTKPPEKGTGLGLATVYGIIVQSKGIITVDSALGQGTTFNIYLPRVFEPAESALAAPADRVADAAGETVLVVEDEEPIRRYVTQVLASAGYTVLAAANGAEALQISGAHPGRIDVLLTDVIMPQMSGAELANRLAAARSGIKIIFTSGYTQDAVVQHGVAKNQAHFLSKPYLKQGLLQKIREALDA